MKRLLFCICVAIGGCHQTAPIKQVAVEHHSENTIKPCPGELDGIALHEIQQRVGSLWYEPERKKRELDRLRNWSEHLPDACLSAAYSNWLDFYDKELPDDFAQERKRKAEDKYRREHPSLPRPPQI